MQSISLHTDRPLDPDKFFPWVQDLVQKEGPNILRCKGILAFKDDDQRFVFQGVHMILDGDHQRPWKTEEKRESRIVFIGRNLPGAADSGRIITGGDDSKLVLTDATGESRILATDPKHRWIDQVALGPDGAVAWSAGKTAYVQAKELRAHEALSTVGGLAFFPKGFRLAIAHYNGATLWFPNASGATPEEFEWKGSHLGATISPDGRFLVTTMQEPMLHGWRLVDRQHMRMSGYATRVMSHAWTPGGQWL